MTLKRVTCDSFSWNKAGDFRTPILCSNMDKNEIEAARAEKMYELCYIRIRKSLYLKNPSSESELNALGSRASDPPYYILSKISRF